MNAENINAGATTDVQVPAQEKLGPWVNERSLGAGGFGKVVLWKNEIGPNKLVQNHVMVRMKCKTTPLAGGSGITIAELKKGDTKQSLQETNEYLALKRCRHPDLLTSRQKERWRQEVSIMKKLNHENVIKSMDVPSELASPNDGVPPMAMEFCEGGDLRKQLNKPENCCGMPEYCVRKIVHDIAAGVEYLQGLSKSIIHRDLKPENIVIYTTPEVTTYKIIDLGYAKEINPDSMCESIVGTELYLAPELHNRCNYTMVVDYWSMGIVIFECITGMRPFLSSLTADQSYPYIAKKKAEDIYIYQSDMGVAYSTKLPPLTHLCRMLQLYLEKWLQMMLRYDPKDRGGGVNEHNRQNCFAVLENILNAKMVHILNVSTNQLLTYPVSDNDTLLTVQAMVENETRIPVSDQEMILASGHIPDAQGNISKYIAFEQPDEQWMIYMFQKNEQFAYSNNITRPLTPFLNKIVQQPTISLDYQQQRKLLCEAVYFCQQQVKDINRIFLCQRAYLLCLLRLLNPLTKLKAQMIQLNQKLQVIIEFFNKSLQDDFQFCAEQTLPEDVVSTVLLSWRTMKIEVNQFTSESDVVGELEQEMNVLENRVSHLDEVNTGPTQVQINIDQLNEQMKFMEQSCSSLKQKSKEEKIAIADHRNLRKMILESKKIKENTLNDLYSKLNRIIECRQTLLDLEPRMQSCCASLETYLKQVQSFQTRRQAIVWDIISYLASQISSNPAQLSPEDEQRLANMNLLMDSPPADELIETTERTRQRLENLLANLERDEVFMPSQDDWSFLNDAPS